MLGSKYLETARSNTNENIHICEQRLYVSEDDDDWDVSKLNDILNHLKAKYS